MTFRSNNLPLNCTSITHCPLCGIAKDDLYFSFVISFSKFIDSRVRSEVATTFNPWINWCVAIVGLKNWSYNVVTQDVTAPATTTFVHRMYPCSIGPEITVKGIPSGKLPKSTESVRLVWYMGCTTTDARSFGVKVHLKMFVPPTCVVVLSIISPDEERILQMNAALRADCVTSTPFASTATMLQVAILPATMASLGLHCTFVKAVDNSTGYAVMFEPPTTFMDGFWSTIRPTTWARPGLTLRLTVWDMEGVSKVVGYTSGNDPEGVTLIKYCLDSWNVAGTTFPKESLATIRQESVVPVTTSLGQSTILLTGSGWPGGMTMELTNICVTTEESEMKIPHFVALYMLAKFAVTKFKLPDMDDTNFNSPTDLSSYSLRATRPKWANVAIVSVDISFEYISRRWIIHCAWPWTFATALHWTSDVGTLIGPEATENDGPFRFADLEPALYLVVSW